MWRSFTEFLLVIFDVQLALRAISLAVRLTPICVCPEVTEGEPVSVTFSAG